MSDAEKQQLREEIAQEKFDKSFDELDSDEVRTRVKTAAGATGPVGLCLQDCDTCS